MKVLVKDSICSELAEDLDELCGVLTQLRKKTILITGANGFIAYYAVLSLLYNNDKNHAENTVILLVRGKEKAAQKYGAMLLRNDIILCTQDVCDPITYKGACDYIIHAASSADTAQFEANPIGTYHANVLGTDNLLQYANRVDCKSFVYLSSFMVYGAGTELLESITEDYIGLSDWNSYKNCYSFGKRSGEHLCQCYAHQLGVPVKIVRPGFIYGASSVDDPRVYAEIIRKIASGDSIILKSNGLVFRSMCYVTDLVRGIFCAMLAGKTGEAYNVASEFCSIREFAQTAAKISNKDICFEKEEDREASIPKTVLGALSSQKIRQECHWNPLFSIEKGLSTSAKIYIARFLTNNG